MSRLTIVKNAFANVCRGGAAAFVTLLLPPFLTRILSKDAYGTWLLILQLSTYVSLLDFGIQTAVGRFVAHHNELEEFKERDSIVSTALAILTGAGLLGIVGISVLSWQLPNLFKSMPAELHQDAQLALLCVGSSLAISLPFSVFGGIFIGFQRYDIPAWIIGISKLLGGFFVVLIAQSSHSIVMMGVVMGMANLLTGFWQYISYRKILGHIHISRKQISKSTVIEVISYCLSFSVWTLAMLLIGGLDTIVVGYFDYHSVVYYTLAASLTIFVVGLQNSLFTVIMPHAAAIGAKGDREALGSLLVSSTRYAVIIMLLTGLPLIVGGKYFLVLWVGDVYADKTFLLLQLLLIGNFIRQIGGPYSLICLAIGEQKQILLSPLVEGLLNLSVSLILTAHIGILGVAIGTIFGSFAGIAMHFFYNLPRSKIIKLKDNNLLLYAIGRPLISVIPILLFVLTNVFFDLQIISIPLMLVFSVISVIILWRIGIVEDEKNKILNKIREQMKKLPSPN
jgi:O-antigen/teichoic acid export membrane protein